MTNQNHQDPRDVSWGDSRSPWQSIMPISSLMVTKIDYFSKIKDDLILLSHMRACKSSYTITDAIHALLWSIDDQF